MKQLSRDNPCKSVHEVSAHPCAIRKRNTNSQDETAKQDLIRVLSVHKVSVFLCAIKYNDCEL